MDYFLWSVCLIGVNIICATMVGVAYYRRSLARLIMYAFPAVVPLFLFFVIRSYWQPDFSTPKSVFFFASMGNFLLYFVAWHRLIGRL